MKNTLGRDIPEAFLTGDEENHGGIAGKQRKEVYRGVHYRDQFVCKKDAPKIRTQGKGGESKVCGSIREAIIKSGLKDGMTISFHHHFREGDYVCNLVMTEIQKLGIKDLFVCASSVGKAQNILVQCIEDGTVTGLSTSGIRDQIGETVSRGKLKKPIFIRSHGGRVAAIESGAVHLDVAFIGASTSDPYGNASGKGGKSNCGVLSYAVVDSEYADHVVVITDTLVAAPNLPAAIQGVDVDSVVVVDKIGDPAKIATGALRLTQDPRELLIAEYAADCVVNTAFFQDGFTFQTGAGGISLAVTRFLKKHMEERKIQMAWGMGGITEPMVDLMHDGYIRKLLNDQAFDVKSVESVYTDPNHYEISASQYANPFNKGAFVNQLDYVILGALEIDVDFNVNVIQGSDGLLQGAPGGHSDTAAGANVTIIVTPLIRSRIASIRDRVTSVTTPGESVDIVVTEYGIAVNPARSDLIESLRETGLPLKTIEQLRDEAYQIVGRPADIQFDDQVVAIVEYRDGTIIDVIRKPARFNE